MAGQLPTTSPCHAHATSTLYPTRLLAGPGDLPRERKRCLPSSGSPFGRWGPTDHFSLMSEHALHLTPELRAHFDSLGVAAVQADVVYRSYRDSNKHAAAVAWLGERDEHDQAREAWRVWMEVALVIIGIAACLVAATWL